MSGLTLDLVRLRSELTLTSPRQSSVRGAMAEAAAATTASVVASFDFNILLATDSYKVTHFKQYPPNTCKIYSYFECRKGKADEFKEIVFFGLQYILKKYLSGSVVTEEKIQQAKQIFDLHFKQSVFHEEGWRYIVTKHNGHLPIRIKAIPEGSIIPRGNVLFTVENTDPNCFWLTNYIESAALGGAAHLVNFQSTDTVAGLLMAQQFYYCQMAGFSIPAAEHSTIISWGRSREKDAFEYLLKQFPSTPISIVSDSYDIFNACKQIWGDDLKNCVEQRNEDSVVVIRPDSGDPVETIMEVIRILEEVFGSTLNHQGYKLLPSFIRVFQGDAINLNSIEKILTALKNEDWSAENIVFGCGGALLQKLNRDTLNCSFKCSYVEQNGKGLDVYKQPVTDPIKGSKRGQLILRRNTDGIFETIQEGKGNPEEDLLVTVFEDGNILQDYTLAEVRKNAKLQAGDLQYLKPIAVPAHRCSLKEKS